METITYTRTDVKFDECEIEALEQAKFVISDLLDIFDDRGLMHVNCDLIDDTITYTKDDLEFVEEILEHIKYATEIYS